MFTADKNKSGDVMSIKILFMVRGIMSVQVLVHVAALCRRPTGSCVFQRKMAADYKPPAAGGLTLSCGCVWTAE